MMMMICKFIKIQGVCYHLLKFAYSHVDVNENLDMLSKKKGEETVTDRDEKLKLVSKWPSVITRSDLRKQSLLSHLNTRSSLQACDLDVNHARILSLLEESHRK